MVGTYSRRALGPQKKNYSVSSTPNPLVTAMATRTRKNWTSVASVLAILPPYAKV